MKNVNLIYKLDGDEEELDKGLNVFYIAPILLSVGELLKEANKTLFPDGREIAVNVKPFKKGSFIIDILIYAHNGCQAIIDFINNNSVEQIKEVLEWLGLLGVLPGGTLFGLIKFLRGQPKSVEQLTPNEIRYTNQKGDSITVNSKVHLLFQNCNIQNVIYDSFGKPLEIQSVSKVETYLNESLDKSKMSQFLKEDAEYIKNYSEAEIPKLNIEEIVENTMDVYLTPKRGSFDGDGKRWSFYMGGATSEPIIANIKDANFLDKHKSGEIKPHVGDVLYVRLLQKIKKIDGRLDLKSTSFEIVKVLNYQEGKTGKQLNFDV